MIRIIIIFQFVFLIFTHQNLLSSNLLMNKYYESLFSSRYNDTRSILSEMSRQYENDPETKFAYANFMLIMYETTSHDEKYCSSCKNYSNEAIEMIRKKKDYNYDDVYNMISVKSILLKIKILNKNYITAAKDIKDIISFFEFALNHEDNNKMKLISGMYNYYVEIAKEDYPIIYPILIFYPSGDKQKGLNLLKECSKTKERIISIKSSLFLARIYRNDEKIYTESKYYFENLLSEYPDNLIWRHEYISTLARFNKNNEAEIQRKLLVEKLNASVHINDEQRKFFLTDYKY
jgi:hypothetical protein